VASNVSNAPHMIATVRTRASWLRNVSRPLRRKITFLRVSASEKVLRRYARYKRSRSSALFIGITGSSGKSTTTSLLSHILADRGRVHTQVFENTIHKLPRTLRDLPSDADFVVAELAIGNGRIAAMAKLLRPNVAVVTKVGMEHRSAFRTLEAIAQEKGELVEALSEAGIAFLNADDPHVMAMAQRCRARIVTFGRSEGADYRVLEADGGFPGTLTVRVRCAKGDFQLKTQFIGEEFWLATVIAFAVSLELGVDPVVAIEKISSFPPIWDRCGVVRVKNGPTFLVDTVKAPYESMSTTLAVLEKAEAKYKRVVIGTISDYAGPSKKPYRQAYATAQAFANHVMFVGETSHRAKPSDTDIEAGRFAAVHSTREASEFIKKHARTDELILIKGSISSHLERIVLDWTMNVRCWEQKCGKTINCLQCGLVEFDYRDHGRVLRERKYERITGRLLPWRNHERDAPKSEAFDSSSTDRTVRSA
jgi:UDP-N-acetylmuramoyl-tripeptide--D-alanyl-D-alanine ligase